MSGGVDSAVAAFLLKEKGYDVVGANMRFWEYKEPEAKPGDDPQKIAKKRITSCCSPEDMGDAERSACGIGIPFYALKMESDFRQKVIDPFIKDYAEGKTPNPCVHCNTFVKFGDFYQKAEALGFEHIATGHYASVVKLDNGRYAVGPAKDEHKDQSYYLYGLNQASLAKTLFPLAELTKAEVRKIAEENNLPVAQKPESQEICFIPDNDYRGFLAGQGVKFQPGFIKNTQGNILAKHQGKEGFTVGQRKGLGIAVGHPMYVLSIEENGDVIVGTEAEIERLTFTVADVIYQGLDPDSFTAPVACLAQVRYNATPVPATITRHDDGLTVELHESAWAITPGQAAVFYEPTEKFILCGGKIQREK